MTKPKPESHPKMRNGFGSKFPASPDGWEHRIRIALRMKNGAVLTARQCRELALELGWAVEAEA